eukprot:TRINITY_DN45766_c0_g1_i1.p1 TRINITY_DN45766_c0_g1~~TRINITY_DN45766_c0_g1_i1.p1  ORF type:complete len:133 (+),score=47.67 TRINITY_DN45766_c0_g1_i1:81-479(+)
MCIRDRYLPSGWHHATLNGEGPTVAAGFQQPGWQDDGCQRHQKLFPRSALFAAQAGQRAVNAHRDAAALYLFRKAAALEPFNCKHALNLASYHLAKKQVETANEIALQALEQPAEQGQEGETDDQAVDSVAT